MARATPPLAGLSRRAGVGSCRCSDRARSPRGTGQDGAERWDLYVPLCPARICDTVPRGRRGKGAVVDRGGQTPARDVNGAAAPLRLAHTTSGEGGCRWQTLMSPGTLARVGQGQWLCHRQPVWRQRVPERSGAGVEVKAFEPLCRALHSPRGSPSASASEGEVPTRGACATIGDEPVSRAPVPPHPHANRFM